AWAPQAVSPARASAGEGALSPPGATGQRETPSVWQLDERGGPGWCGNRQREPVTVPGPPDEYPSIRCRDRTCRPPEAAGMRRDGEGLVARVHRLHAEHVAGQDRRRAGCPAMGQAGPRLSRCPVGTDVLPHGPGEERVLRV